jgi:HEAT repeat protein
MTRTMQFLNKTKNGLAKTAAAIGVACLITFSSFTPKSESILSVPTAQAQEPRERINKLLKIFHVKNLKNKSKEIQDAYRELAKVGKPAVPAMINALNDKAWYVRSKAAVTLGLIGDKSAVPNLVYAVKNDKNKVVRYEAASSLGWIRDASAVSALVDALRDKESRVRQNAASALSIISDPNSRSSLPWLFSDGRNFRKRDKDALKKIKEASAVPALIEATRDKFWYVRANAIVALQHIDDSSAIPALTNALKDKNRKVRVSAALALIYMKAPTEAPVPVLIKELKKEKNQNCWDMNVIALAEFSKTNPQSPETHKAITVLDRILRKKCKAGGRGSSDIADLLGRFGEPAATVLIKALNDKNKCVKDAGFSSLLDPDTRKVVCPKLGKNDYSGAVSFCKRHDM